MKIKCVLMIFLITIFLIAILNSVYADNGPKIGENQAKKIAQNYLNSNKLPYTVTTIVDLVEIKNKKTGETKWVTWPQWQNMSQGYYLNNHDDPGFENYEWARAGIYTINKTVYDTSWKITVVDNNGNNVGNIWINDITGDITTINLKSVNNTNSNQTNTTNSTNTANQVPQANNNNLWIIGAIVIVIIAAGGYWFYKKS